MNALVKDCRIVLISFSPRSEYGWAGHTDNSGIQGRSVKEFLERVTLYSLEQVLKSITVWTITNQDIYLDYENIKILRTNYPYNCYSLDLANNNDVKGKGVKQLFLEFYISKKVSVDILLEGQSLTSFRPIKAHRFHSSGADITLGNLGERNILLFCFIVSCFISRRA